MFMSGHDESTATMTARPVCANSRINECIETNRREAMTSA